MTSRLRARRAKRPQQSMFHVTVVVSLFAAILAGEWLFQQYTQLMGLR